MFYLATVVAITGAVGYHCFVKLITPTINRLFSVLGVYLAVLFWGHNSTNLPLKLWTNITFSTDKLGSIDYCSYSDND